MPHSEELVIANIMEGLPVGILVIRPDGIIAAANPAAAEILDMVDAPMQDQPWADLFLEDAGSSDLADAILEAVQHGAVGLQKSIAHQRKDGKTSHLQVTTSYLKENDTIVAVVLLLEDETERVEMLKRENRHLREIHQLQDARVKGLNKLALSVAHQIRNPLMTIGGFGAMMLREQEPGSPYSHHLEVILEEARRLENVVASVRDYAQLRPARRSRVPSCVLLAELEDHANNRAKNDGRTLEWITACPVVDFFVDHELFLKAMQALIDNAFDFTEQHPLRLRVMASAEDDACVITVRDNGPGVSQEHLPFAFDPFYSSKPDGVGMGLPTARRIIAEHGGTLTLHSRENGAEAMVVMGPEALVFPENEQRQNKDAPHNLLPEQE
ncbi:two-component system sensor histidine kinase NtrB [Pseudodesulfovibrio senegalensis]|uniref:histidine kinase n=1 Tax=Pseudodesulfovibrio senegalensis TaxID=1721087 RepID=A0A6N6N460_9BACT|nr:ATP-binding protein [Pseudodesulfovibrio senegalensis]KAB1442834.1 PAS domain-containing protein [Pseudodesulfovibrio senegalensis]